MSDAEFMNDYQQTLLDNLNTVIKQNVLFQTQLKQVANKEQTIQELTSKVQALESSMPENVDLPLLQQNLSNLETQVGSLTGEKNRVQAELNKTTQEKQFLENENVSLKEKIREYDSIKSQIEQHKDIHEEKSRLQSELSRVISEKNSIESSLKKTINELLLKKDELMNKLTEQEESITLYKSMIAPSKLRSLFKKIEKKENKKTQVDSG